MDGALGLDCTVHHAYKHTALYRSDSHEKYPFQYLQAPHASQLYIEITSNINFCQSSAPIYPFNFLKRWYPGTVCDEGCFVSILSTLGWSIPHARQPYLLPACLSDPGVSSWVTLSPVVWLTKIMPCPEQHQPILSSATTLQLWLCFDDPLQQQQQQQQQQQRQQRQQCLLIQINNFL